MSGTNAKHVRVAVLDLYDGFPNQGMRCIRDILLQFAEGQQLNVVWDEFDVRTKQELPDLSYDVYISSGGPGSPLESKGTEWEKHFFSWISNIKKWNDNPLEENKKHVFFICHSFQLACRYFEVGQVCARKSTAFGVFPVHLMNGADDELVFDGLKDPFYAVDSRDYQVIQPDHQHLKAIGAKLLCIEKDRPHVALERAIMAVRFNEFMIGTQFHPEADAIGMSMYLQTEEKKKTVIDNHGFEKWKSMIEHLEDPDKILYTYSHILPNFLYRAFFSMTPVTV
ncbi:MAG: GMP synthase [Chitinophagaceae bacterium]|jgi:homoserine O-succinyltransferase/O-acetyltransferase|nr:GMP synthase [Chitinophagaceae bacterium]